MPNFIHKRSYLDDQGKPEKRLLLSRYGGLGDMLMVASVLPGLKKQGYHITLNTTPAGRDVLLHDPHIDKFLLQDKNQVPGEQLTAYWTALEQEYDRCINMSESLEGTLLKLPGRRDHALPHVARRMICDINYLEFAHAIAGVPGEPESVFYSSDAEKDWALGFRKKHKKSPVILWSLGGSSVHKVYPWVDTVTGWILEQTDCKVLYVGGPSEQHIEYQIVKMLANRFLSMTEEDTAEMKLSELLAVLKKHFGQTRVLCTSGGWSVRKMLTFAAEQADLVIGPETGVMHAAGFRDVPKICFLSHSTANNLTRDWKNCTSLLPVQTPCYPCHIMHMDWSSCVKDEKSGAAMCATSITPERVFESILYWLKERSLWTA